jgi:hypothetical protein
VPNEDIVKGYQLEKDQFIEVTKEELEELALESTRTIEIDEFVDRTEIDPRYLIRPYYLVPDGKVGHDAFAVIRETIREMDKVAIGRLVLTNREHIIALEPLDKGLMGTLRQVAIAPDQVRDPFEKNVPGIGVGRDGCRTPMQWSAAPHGGFSELTPWLPLADDFAHENVVNLEADERSILSLYKALINLRKKWPELVTGDYVPMAAEEDLLLYRRQGSEGSVVIALNLGAEPVSLASDARRNCFQP